MSKNHNDKFKEIFTKAKKMAKLLDLKVDDLKHVVAQRKNIFKTLLSSIRIGYSEERFDSSITSKSIRWPAIYITVFSKTSVGIGIWEKLD